MHEYKSEDPRKTGRTWFHPCTTHQHTVSGPEGDRPADNVSQRMMLCHIITRTLLSRSSVSHPYWKQGFREKNKKKKTKKLMMIKKKMNPQALARRIRAPSKGRLWIFPNQEAFPNLEVFPRISAISTLSRCLNPIAEERIFWENSRYSSSHPFIKDLHSSLSVAEVKKPLHRYSAFVVGRYFHSGRVVLQQQAPEFETERLFQAIDGGSRNTDSSDETSSKHRVAEDEGLLIEKLPISRILVNNLEKRGITKLFPIQVYKYNKFQYS